MDTLKKIIINTFYSFALLMLLLSLQSQYAQQSGILALSDYPCYTFQVRLERGGGGGGKGNAQKDYSVLSDRNMAFLCDDLDKASLGLYDPRRLLDLGVLYQVDETVPITENTIAISEDFFFRATPHNRLSLMVGAKKARDRLYFAAMAM